MKCNKITVRDLIKQLQKLEQNKEINIIKDSSGWRYNQIPIEEVRDECGNIVSYTINATK